jgi:hypothetical protein
VSGLRCDDDADAELARLDVVDDDDECTPLFTFVGALGYMTDCNRQVLAAGYVRVDRGDGYWQWERRPSADRAASEAAVGPQHS